MTDKLPVPDDTEPSPPLTDSLASLEAEGKSRLAAFVGHIHGDLPCRVCDDMESYPAVRANLTEMLASEIQSVSSHREMSKAETEGTEADHEAGRLLAQRMTGRKMPKRSSAERERAARMHERIADKAESRAQALAAAIEALDAVEQHKAGGHDPVERSEPAR